MNYLNGLVYLRTWNVIVRYEPETWREVPFDYGEEHEKVMVATKAAPVLSGLTFAGTGLWHHGGMSISPKGHVALGCMWSPKPENRFNTPNVQAKTSGKTYVPELFAGRLYGSKHEIVHVWDKHGKMLYADAIPGLPSTDGVWIDKDDALYVMAAARRYLDGQIHFDPWSGTLLKFHPKKGRIVCSKDTEIVPMVLPKESWPKRPPDFESQILNQAWVEGAEWKYGGVGYAALARGIEGAIGQCSCSNARFALDYYGRSFAPELARYAVAVLDTNGNLILRVGRYGNEDDGKPLVPDGGSPAARSIGGDETALFYPAYVAAHTDRRLFIADIGNSRIASVRLDYHASERVHLKDIPNTVQGK